jgi:hypothetical protein
MSKKHKLIMLACCVIGMGSVLAVFVFQVPVNNVLFGLMLLICPLSHVLMMGMMGKDHNHTQHTPAELPKAPYQSQEMNR